MGKLMFHGNNIGGGVAYQVTTFEVDTSNWVADTTSQSGKTLYVKEISLNHVSKERPDIAIGSATRGTLPTTAQQTAYNLIQYTMVDPELLKLYIYASATPATTFYIEIEGVD